MRVSTRGRYALRVMIDLAQSDPNQGDAMVKLKDISARIDVSRNYLVQLLISLKNAGLVRSTSGKNGGYSLMRPASEITTHEIVEAAIGPININECVLNHEICDRSDTCRAREFWAVLNQCIIHMLGHVTLEQLADPKCDLHKLVCAARMGKSK